MYNDDKHNSKTTKKSEMNNAADEHFIYEALNKSTIERTYSEHTHIHIAVRRIKLKGTKYQKKSSNVRSFVLCIHIVLTPCDVKTRTHAQVIF